MARHFIVSPIHLYRNLLLVLITSSSGVYSSCGFIYMALTPGITSVTSLNFPNPAPNLKNCVSEFVIPFGRTDFYMEITFADFDLGSEMPACSDNYLEIFIGNHTLGKFCGTSAPPPIFSLGENIKVSLTTDGIPNRRGFNLTYELKARTSQQLIGNKKHNSCSSLTTATGTLLFAEPWPLASWQQIVCTYTIYPPAGYSTRILIMHSSMVQSQGKCDNSIILQGSNNGAPFIIYNERCENIHGAIVQTSDSEITITVRLSNEPVEYTGFMMGFSTFKSNAFPAPTSTASTTNSTSRILIGCGIAIFVCIAVLFLLFWKRRRYLAMSSGVPCSNNNRRIPSDCTPSLERDIATQPTAQPRVVLPSYSEAVTTTGSDEPPPPYTMYIGTENRGF